ncbi:MAG: hypothetical protein K2M88_08750, partial [Muribaculaceae bacterium]|nr:hypothetical protein [Muribaculaceae bacterium]
GRRLVSPLRHPPHSAHPDNPTEWGCIPINRGLKPAGLKPSVDKTDHPPHSAHPAVAGWADDIY